MPQPYKTILSYFLTWRILLFLVAFLAGIFITTFGARFPYWDSTLEITGLPNWIWGFGNFDGVHYLKIAQRLYTDVHSQVFFPLFPLLVRALSFLVPKMPDLDLRFFVDPAYFYSGLILANMFFLISLVFLYKLFHLDFDEKTTKRSLVLLLAFPTAFYFGSIYTESLFLLLSVLGLYFLRKKQYFLSSLFISLATATRFIGVFLILVYLIEILKEKLDWKKLAGLLIAPTGVLLYVYYLHIAFGNPFYFITSQSTFGAERLKNGIILLPQVFFRYLFRIFPSVPVFSLSFFVAFLEIAFTTLVLIALVIYYKKMRKSYWWFTFLAIILPTLTGTFSSMPRYILSAYLVLPFLAESKYYKVLLLIFGILQMILVSMFVRGYWVA